VFEHEILDNKECIEKFYCPFHRLVNNGFLAQVSPKYRYVGLGLSLLQTVADAVNKKILNKNSGETLKMTVALAKDPKGPLKQSFWNFARTMIALLLNTKGSYLMSLLTRRRIQEKARSSRAIEPKQLTEVHNQKPALLSVLKLKHWRRKAEVV
jgi:hypothetical protein